MAGHLVEVTTKDRIPLQDTMLLGRKKDCHIRLTDSRVSRQHAMIRRQDDGDYWFYDLGSSNGSYINDQRVITTRKLGNSDTIRICDHEYQFDAGSGSLDAGGLPEDALDATISEIRTIPVVMLVSDIKGFTKISEALPPDLLAQTIGSWYRECDEVLSEHGATVDKFIGDAVLAYWMDVNPETRARALTGARALRQACDRIAERQAGTFAEHGLVLESGIGLHLGKVAHGQMGQGAFTMLGDAVNITFRLESLTRPLKRQILVSDEFLTGWNEGYQFCRHEGSHIVKGRTTPLEVYSVKTFPDGQSS